MLDDSEATVRETRMARKEPLSDREARALLEQVGKVLVAKGRKVVELKAADAKLADLRGPSGNVRAPLIRRGKTLLVGFNEEALRSLL